MVIFKHIIIILLFGSNLLGQRELDVLAIDNDTYVSKDRSIIIEHIKRFQNFDPNKNDHFSKYDIQINSPKSVIFSKNGTKFYVQALEGYATLVFDSKTLKRIKVIKHRFSNDSLLFINDTSFEEQISKTPFSNKFNGKPVESCLTHDGKYLWVTYYRRDYDKNALLPSALAIINTINDSIVRVIPTDPLPKMIKYNKEKGIIAVTHWGNNTVGIIDVNSKDVAEYKYKKLITIGKKYEPKSVDGNKINRDKFCGHCLRGTAFTEDGRYLFVGKMSGGGIAMIDMNNYELITTFTGMKRNVRHLMVTNGQLYLSSNSDGFIQFAPIEELISSYQKKKLKKTMTKFWKSKYIGPGARTFDISTNYKYLFATVNNQSKIVVLNTSLKKVGEFYADSYPVGLAISPDNRLLISTSQGKSGVGGNSINIFKITYSE